jgi:hypothetical protein
VIDYRVRSHDGDSCHLCESVSAEAYRRHWKHEAKAGSWHVIGDGPDLMARLPRQAHFTTALSYQLGSGGAPTRYYGSLYWEFDATERTHALEDLRRIIELLAVEYDCPLEALHVWHSGGRGFHVTIPPIVIGAEAGHPQLPRVYAVMIHQVFPPRVAPTLDRSVYSMGRGRMWRLPNRLRADTGRYKVPLTIREVLHKPYAHLEALTYRPRKGIFWPPDAELSPCPELVQLYQETAAAIERATFAQPPHHGDESLPCGNVELLLHRCAFIRHCRDNAVTLTEPEWYAMVSNVARCTDGAPAVHRLSAPYPGYSSEETEEKIAHALADTGPHTCAFIQGVGFKGCPPGGCGVNAPIVLRHPPALLVTAGAFGNTGYAPPHPVRGIHQPPRTDSTPSKPGEERYAW